MARVRRTPQADADLQDIWTYMAKDNPSAADELIRRIDESFRQISSQPDIGIRMDDIRPGR